jgi:hypothetical protein
LGVTDLGRRAGKSKCCPTSGFAPSLCFNVLLLVLSGDFAHEYETYGIFEWGYFSEERLPKLLRVIWIFLSPNLLHPEHSCCYWELLIRIETVARTLRQSLRTQVIRSTNVGEKQSSKTLQPLEPEMLK